MKMKKDKQLKARYGKLAESMAAYYDHLDLRPFGDLDDEGFAYLIANVKGVNMLDLNETDISNESIKLLTRFEYVKELRAKGCRFLNDGCVEDLDKITSLEFLHVKNTGITIDGLLQLGALTNLKELLFSADDTAQIEEKMWRLKNMMPGCAFVINSKPYYFDAVDYFINAVNTVPVTYRLKVKNERAVIEWSNWLIKPGDSYVEVATQGPYPINDIEWIDINPLENHKAGKLVPAKLIDHSGEIIKMLEDLSIPYLVVEGIIRMFIVKNGL